MLLLIPMLLFLQEKKKLLKHEHTKIPKLKPSHGHLWPAGGKEKLSTDTRRHERWQYRVSGLIQAVIAVKQYRVSAGTLLD